MTWRRFYDTARTISEEADGCHVGDFQTIDLKGGDEMAERNMFDLSGRVALVTGGGYGIGRSICEAMAEFGADVAIADINEELAQETVRLIAKFGHRALVIKADVSNSSDVEHMVNEIVTKLGAIDILFNNAGFVIGDSRIHETTDEVWDKTMAVNLRGCSCVPELYYQ